MSRDRMHADELPVDAALVRRLLAAQFPRWAHLRLEPVESSGTEAAWTVCTADARDAFRVASRTDDAAWARGRGWALRFGLVALPYYLRTNPVLVRIARRAIGEVLADADGR